MSFLEIQNKAEGSYFRYKILPTPFPVMKMYLFFHSFLIASLSFCIACGCNNNALKTCTGIPSKMLCFLQIWSNCIQITLVLYCLGLHAQKRDYKRDWKTKPALIPLMGDIGFASYFVSTVVVWCWDAVKGILCNWGWAKTAEDFDWSGQNVGR